MERKGKMTQILESGELDGYEPQFPRWTMEFVSIDIDVARESKCGECGLIGMEAHPFVNKLAGSYRVFAVCPRCDYAEEF